MKKIFSSAMQGVFWILPITAIIFIVLWIFDQISFIMDDLFGLLGFNPKEYELIWTGIGIIIVICILAIVGWIATTRLAVYLESIVTRIPFYSTIKDIVGIFNSSKNDNNTNVLVVAIHGFTGVGYNIGLMYSLKESIIKDHYTITLSMSPIPNGGFMFEIHKDQIFVLEGATFNDNLTYLLSMGTKSMTEILEIDSQAELVSLAEYLNK